MSDEFTSAKCSPSDCATCGENCSGSSVNEHNTITLTLEDDTEVECAILTVFPVDEKEYMALLPLDENGQNQAGEVYLYSFARTENGDPILSNIESDEEYAKAAQAFDIVLDNARKAEAAGEPLE
nr:DUF1292 domain-containing protein [uncultured Blautia sp.]